MKNSPLKTMFFGFILTAGATSVASGAPPVASPPDAKAGACGGARFKNGLFANRLSQIDKRTESLCKQQTAALKRLEAMEKNCGKGDFKSYIELFAKRGNQLCTKGGQAVKETKQFCQEYDGAVAKSKGGLAIATTNTRNQSEAFSNRSTALQGASGEMTQAARRADSLARRIDGYLPSAKKGQSGSSDPELAQLTERLKGTAAATKSSPACRQVAQGLEQYATLLQQNLMPNLRALQEGVDDVKTNVAKSAADLGTTATQDAALAAKFKEEARNQPLNQVNPAAQAARGPASVPAINQPQISPKAQKRIDDQKILTDLYQGSAMP